MYKVKPTNIPEQSSNNERQNQMKKQKFSHESIIQVFLHSFGAKDLSVVFFKISKLYNFYFKCCHWGRITFLF